MILWCSYELLSRRPVFLQFRCSRTHTLTYTYTGTHAHMQCLLCSFCHKAGMRQNMKKEAWQPHAIVKLGPL